jgi:hypothetical protein
MFDTTGCRKVICDFLADVILAELHKIGVPDALDVWTETLTRRTGYWGPSRKALNLFLRDATYNHWMRDGYELAAAEDKLEIPLDGIVMDGLRERDASLPASSSVKRLTPEHSALYQHAAAKIAADRGCVRVHLDLVFWNGGFAGREAS